MHSVRFPRRTATALLCALLATGAIAQKTIPPAVPAACADVASKTRLLFNFVTNQAGFDTGIALSNTGADPFGTVGAPGVCTLTFYGAGAPAAFVTPTLVPGQTYANTASTIAPGFQGYAIAVCDFPYGHGFALVSDVGAKALATSYLPGNVCAPRVAPD